ncbi:glycosyltransferase involved in cell wall biosynthesis [Novosphingobium sp. PhB57]|nr:glycosyltransferase involved in cell wall biosynthesis [Novosphingobium sp. PhB57]
MPSDFRPILPICVDGRMLLDGGAGTGVGQYARTVIATLKANGVPTAILDDLGPSERRSRIAKFVAASRPWERVAVESRNGFSARDVFREAQVFFDIYKRPMPIILPGKPGVMHWSYPLPVRAIGWRNLYTIHDVLPLDPAIPSPVNGLRLRRILNSLRRYGGNFATVTDAAHSQIVSKMGWPSDTVVCCHQGVDVSEAQDGILPPGLVPGAYLLYVGAVEARKNLHRLLQSYCESGIKTPLVISGPDGMDAQRINQCIAATPGAIRLGLQSRKNVLRLIADARALVFVSLAEGFGLPVVEAMALGTPVLSADVPALVEVGGGATLLADPLNTTSLREAMIAIDLDAILRDRLSTLGSRRARYFTFGPYAQRLLSLYEIS